MPTLSETDFQLLKAFFERPVCVAGTKPLRDGIQIAVHLAGAGPVTLQKRGGRPEVLSSPPEKPQMTFHVPSKGLQQLVSTQTEDVGEIGVAILKLMAHSDPEYHVTAKVHIGLFDLLRNGYLGVLPLGGATVMKFLGTKGFGSIGKIKEAIGRLRT
jgi:hypothetical protein